MGRVALREVDPTPPAFRCIVNYMVALEAGDTPPSTVLANLR